MFHDIEQNTDDWLGRRAGKVTSSNLAKVMANDGKAFNDPAKVYAVNIAIERITGKPVSGGFNNYHMERGKEQEPIARALYENETFCTVTNGGFFDFGVTGLSPDGLVSNDGIIEIKCVVGNAHFKNVKRNNVDPAYKWQCVGNLMHTGRDWLDFISYCSEYPVDKQLFIYRLEAYKYKDEFKRLRERTAEFEKFIQLTQEIILTSEYAS